MRIRSQTLQAPAGDKRCGILRAVTPRSHDIIAVSSARGASALWLRFEWTASRVVANVIGEPSGCRNRYARRERWNNANRLASPLEGDP
jgi:hypothetical protein